MSKRILIVEDDAFVRKILESRLNKLGYESFCAENTGSAIHFCLEQAPDLMILDLNLIDAESMDGIRDGFGFLEWLNRNLPDANVPVIIFTGAPYLCPPSRTLPKNVIAALKKQRDLSHLFNLVRRALDGKAAA